MSDYTLNSEEEHYIKSYKCKKKKGKIIVKLENGESYTLPYNEENKKAVASKVECQDILEERNISDKIFSILSPLTLGLSAYCLISYDPNFLVGVSFVASVVSTAFFTLEGIAVSKAKRKMGELNSFLEEQQELNKSLDKSKNMDTKKVKKLKINIDITKEQDHQLPNIDNLSLKDLKEIIEKIAIASSEDFTEEEITMNVPSQKQDPQLPDIDNLSLKDLKELIEKIAIASSENLIEEETVVDDTSQEQQNPVFQKNK